ncbi:hypothetical protein C2869_05280 [Saccharobesus litoralis]|uniref:Cytochrome c domain-containing protein n=1 Tax=Saccharobesus litoralis TaxID=2172099 RepID=A0A2S0VNV1_9ALTE|nr:PQQ-dependent sugar dehydrogenase [Saccharobesus litoralis]AWB65888.1 hypothetical protein C2869_05280 [Saccharobesus litoralis]
MMLNLMCRGLQFTALLTLMIACSEHQEPNEKTNEDLAKPLATNNPVNKKVATAPKKVDLVAIGKEAFTASGCIECHATKENDSAFKTGPNLFGLFQQPAIKREVQLFNGERTMVVADAGYLSRSLIAPESELAIRQTGVEKGQAYFPVMPKFKWPWNDIRKKAMYEYLRTLNPPGKQGPAQVWHAAKKHQALKPKQTYDHQMWVGEQASIARFMIPGVSTRAIHVGLTNGVNYSFDTVDMSIKKIWWGGFLDATRERTGRGMGLNSLGKEALDWQIDYLVKPLDQRQQAIDLSFKSWPAYPHNHQRDTHRINLEKSVNTPYLQQVAAANAQYLGLDTTDKQNPQLRFEIEGVKYRQTTKINNLGHVEIQFAASQVKRDLQFLVNTQDNQVLAISAGSINNGIWRIPQKQSQQFTIKLKPIALPIQPKRNQVKPAFSHDKQKVVIKNYELASVLPAGYRLESVMAPKDRFGRDQLFEPLALDFAQNGTAVVASRTSGIWQIKDQHWHFFAEGFHDPLGVHIEDKQGNQVVVAHKPELTRVIDKNADGLADLFQTINDDWRLAGNYCEYVHGPVIDEQGNYYFNLNLAHGADTVSGQAMGTYGGYDGWLMRVTQQGELQPWASGLRSPAGLGRGPQDLLLYTDNQGSFVGTSKMHVVDKGDYFGYPASLKDHDNYFGKPINWQQVNQLAEKPAVYFPHGIVANSPGNPTFDNTQGQFGPFAGQILVGDQTMSNISRVDLQKVNGQWQGVVIPFIKGLSSGAMRLSFAPDNSLWIGQTGRGWAARGGEYEALQRLSWDGTTVPFEMKTVKHVHGGFVISFTQDLAEQNIKLEDVQLESWNYLNSPVYGSPRYFHQKHQTQDIIKLNNKQIKIKVAGMVADRIYQIKLKGLQSSQGDKPSNNAAYYTLHELL